MNKSNLIEAIQNKDYTSFKQVWTSLLPSLTTSNKEALLVEIVEEHYEDRHLSFFKRVFDLILESKVSLDFKIEHWAPTFLSLSVLKASRTLFDYFLKKGASINFIGKRRSDQDDETGLKDAHYAEQDQYATCLDFAQKLLNDFLTVDYQFNVPDRITLIQKENTSSEDDKILIDRAQYENLIEQAHYLRTLIHTDRLVDHIRSLGGRTINELIEQP